MLAVAVGEGTPLVLEEPEVVEQAQLLEPITRLLGLQIQVVAVEVKHWLLRLVRQAALESSSLNTLPSPITKSSNHLALGLARLV